jgi:glutamate carboxypeptidase
MTTRADAQRVLDWLDGRQPAMVELLERLALAESPTLDRRSQEAVYLILAQELEQIGYAARQVRGYEVGGHLYARAAKRTRGASRQLVVGHMDTVWPLGTLAGMPVERRDDALYGPGVYDMKAGLVQLVFALRVLGALGLEPEVTPVLLVVSDEEVGSRESGRFVRLLARGAVRAFVLEPPSGTTGKLKTARKGVGRFTLTVHGRASHAGTDFEQGVSAILELSHQIQHLFALNDHDRGITVNVGTIDGGLRPNVVAPEAAALVDVRVPSAEAGAELEAQIRGLRPVLPGCSLEVKGGMGRPPMEPLPRNRALFETARRLAAELHLDLEEADQVGGGSDANTTSLYTATLDGLGAIGAGAHAVDEHVVVSRLAERTALLALLLLEPAPSSGNPQVASLVRPGHGSGRPLTRPLIAVLGSSAHTTNAALVPAWCELGLRAELVAPHEARSRLREGDIVLGRIDVLPTVDGVEPGLLELLLLERRGYRVLNPAAALLAAHDKLRTARLLQLAALLQPRTAHLSPGSSLPDLPPPLVVKPRFGSWGVDVFRCDTRAELESCLAEVGSRLWFRRHGALLQELLPIPEYDLRLVIAGGTVVGAIERVPRPGDWRTNISLGGSIRSARPTREACRLGLAAAAAIGADLVGVDLLPLPGGGYSIVELNGAVDFSAVYALGEADVFAQTAAVLGLLGGSVPTGGGALAPERAEALSTSKAG